MIRVFSILAILFLATCTGNNMSNSTDTNEPAISPSPQNQVYDPVDWSFKVEQNGADVTFIATATIEDKWHLYSQFLPDNGMGPVPTSFTFEGKEKGLYELVGKAKESKTETHYDPNFDMDLTFFADKAVFRQKIKVKSSSDFELKGFVDFMVCDDQKCLPPDYEEFTLKIKGVSGGNDVKQEDEEGQNDDVIDGETDQSLNTPDSTENSPAEGMESPVTFKVPVKRNGDEFTLDFRAFVEPGWIVPTYKNEKFKVLSVQIDENENYTVEGDLSFFDEKTDTIHWLDNKLMKGFIGTGSFQQTIYAKISDSLPTVTGTISFIAVNMEDTSVIKNSVPVKFRADLNNAVNVEEKEADKSYLGIFIAAFLSGFLALLTPCVFPMIPMTVSFFTKQSKNRALGIRNAIIYGLSIIIIYVALGLIITLSFGPDALNAMSTNIWFNIAFFVLFVIFAISFFGAFEIKLPSSWVNKADKQADRGGLIGIFFMAFTLALVSFSCTGPIIGSLLVQAAQTGVSGPFVGMLGFSLALALPFALLAIFPGWLNSLPQSGGWLNSVKVVLGFVELALAFKFLSNADLVIQAHLLEREVFIAIWIAIFTLMGFYLLGKLKFAHDSDLQFLSVPRLLFSIVTFSFVMYLIPGMWGAPLNWLSGFPPPKSYSESPYGVGGRPPEKDKDLPESAHVMANGIVTIHDYEEGMAYAKKKSKPVMLDFTGYACVNCRKMEENVWPKDEVLSLLKDDFVIISLYVDDKTMLPDSEQYVSETTGKKIRTIGNKWSDFQTKNYKSNSQPQYVIVDHDMNQLIETASYQTHGDPEVYSEWLQKGLKAFNAVHNAKTITPQVESWPTNEFFPFVTISKPELDFKKEPFGVQASDKKIEGMPKSAEMFDNDFNSGLVVIKDLEEGLAYAKQENKPIMLDFTGYACVNCRKMEEHVWSDPQVFSILKNDLILVSLYVDDKTELPEDEQYKSEETGRRIRTYGNKWSEYQVVNYKSNSQPLYVMIDSDEDELMKEFASYQSHNNPKDFAAWLKKGVQAYAKQKANI